MQQFPSNNSSPGVQRSGSTDNSSIKKGELEENEQAPRRTDEDQLFFQHGTTTAVSTPGRELANKFSGHGPGKPLNPPHQKQTQARLQQSQLHTRGSSSSSSSDSNTSGTAKAAANYALSTEAKASMEEKNGHGSEGGTLGRVSSNDRSHWRDPDNDK